jgi:copper chaperone CopZ
MTNLRLLTLPMTEMACANCVETVKRNLKKLGVFQSTAVNLSSEGPTVVLPAGKTFAEGIACYFIHSEVSDAEIATYLNIMMPSSDLLVPGLTNSSWNDFADVHVLSNGSEGMGPLGFQMDVFENPPGSEVYSHIPQQNLATWTVSIKERLLKSSSKMQAARDDSEVSMNSQVSWSTYHSWSGMAESI